MKRSLHRLRDVCCALGVGVAVFGCATRKTEPAAPTPEPSGLTTPAPPVVPAPLAKPADIGLETAGEPPADAGVVSARFGRVSMLALETRLWEEAPATPARTKPEPVERWRQRRAIHVGKSHLATAELSDDERHVLALSDAEGLLRVYDVADGKLRSSAPLPGYEPFARGDVTWWPPHGNELRVVYANDDGLWLLAAESGRVVTELSQNGAWRLRWAAGLLGATLSMIPEQRSTLVLYRVAGPERLEPALVLAFDERVDEWALSTDRRRLGVIYYPSEEIEWLDLFDRRVAWTERAPRYASSLDLSPDGAKLAVGGELVRIYEVAHPERHAEFRSFDNNVHRVRFTPAGDALAASAYDGRIRILDVSTAEPELRLRKLLHHGGTANVYALDFSRDGAWLVSSSGDQTLRFWGE